jgi:hypothetical protein
MNTWSQMNISTAQYINSCVWSWLATRIQVEIPSISTRRAYGFIFQMDACTQIELSQSIEIWIPCSAKNVLSFFFLMDNVDVWNLSNYEGKHSHVFVPTSQIYSGKNGFIFMPYNSKKYHWWWLVINPWLPLSRFRSLMTMISKLRMWTTTCMG